MRFEKIIQLVPAIIIIFFMVAYFSLNKSFVMNKYNANPTVFVTTVVVAFIIVLSIGFFASKIIM